MNRNSCIVLLAIFQIVSVGLLILFKRIGVPGIAFYGIEAMGLLIVSLCRSHVVLKQAKKVLPQNEYERLKDALIMRIHPEILKEAKYRQLLQGYQMPLPLGIVSFAILAIGFLVLR